MTDIKYDFFDISFDVSNTKHHNAPATLYSYIKLEYPGDNNKPVINYNGLQFYPVNLFIGQTTRDNYGMVLETVNKLNGNTGIKLFIKMIIIHDSNSPNKSLTSLFTAISTNGLLTQQSPALVKLNDLFGDPVVYSKSDNKLYTSNTSSDLTLIISGVNLADLSQNSVNNVIKGITDFPTICTNIAKGDEPSPITNIKLIATPLTQRQRCTRSTDNASTVVPVVKADTTSVQTNILVLVIIGLCVAAFFPTIYYFTVCLPAGDNIRHGAIQRTYLIGALSMVIPLFVRGFKEGDIASQVWGVGILTNILIFVWKYVDLSSKQILKCDSGPVSGVEKWSELPEHFSLFFTGRTNILFIIALIIFGSVASRFASDINIFGSLLGVQAFLTVLVVILFGIYDTP